MFFSPDLKTNDEMVEQLVKDGRLKEEKNISAFRSVSRGFFFPTKNRPDAFKDNALRINHVKYGILHQSAPHMYGMAVELLDFIPGSKFLNVGSGTGYLSAIVAHLIGPTGVNHGVEVREGNVAFARRGLEEFFSHSSKFAPVVLRHGNALLLDAERNIKYDRIYIGAGTPSHCVGLFLRLLANGGRLLVPEDGELRLYKKDEEGNITHDMVCRVAFAELEEPTTEELGAASKFTIETEEDELAINSIYDMVTIDSTALNPKSGFVVLHCGDETGGDEQATNSHKQEAKEQIGEQRNEEPKTQVMISFHIQTMRPFVTRLYNVLRRRGVSVWICTESLVGGSHWRKEISRAIRECTVFIPVINKEWVNSGECEIELNMALYRHLHADDRTPQFYPLLHHSVPPQDEKIAHVMAQFNARALNDSNEFLTEVADGVVSLLGDSCKLVPPAPTMENQTVETKDFPSSLDLFTIEDVCRFVESIGLDSSPFRVNAVNGKDLHEFEMEFESGDDSLYKELNLNKLQLRKLRKYLVQPYI
eukprot:m.60985 g.60985  ORF g.60985 m.60985 type:complete len:534 (-) comp11371_c0_seq2:269-1870(-)